jgi:glycosyltransferase involved in cell wall biosynthesis
MRLGWLASSYPRAVDTAVRNEVAILRERGHEVRTFAIRRTEPSQLTSELHRREAASTVYLYSDHVRSAPFRSLALLARSPSRWLRGARLALSTRAPGLEAAVRQVAYFLEASVLADELVRGRVEHLHCHIAENPASVAMLASELSGVPWSMTVHGPYEFRAVEAWAFAEKLKRAAFTVCITEFTRSQCMMFLPPEEWRRLELVRCGPDPSFLAAEPPPPTDARRLVWVGRICEEKGVPILLEALSRIAREGLDFSCVMIGDGPLRGWTERRAAEIGLSARIQITGWLNGDEVRKQLGAARGLVLPSFAEGLPAVLMEALALERPVISTYIAGIPELVVPGVNGWLVPAGSPGALADALRQLLAASPERLHAMGAAGRRAVLSLHDARIEVARLEARIASEIGA